MTGPNTRRFRAQRSTSAAKSRSISNNLAGHHSSDYVLTCYISELLWYGTQPGSQSKHSQHGE